MRLEPEYLRDKSRWLVNLSSASLSADEEVLKLSPKFAPSPRKIPYMDIAAGVEAALHYAKLPKEVCEEVTSRVCTALHAQVVQAAGRVGGHICC